MKEVNVRKDDLLEVLKENREKHYDLYEKALKGYKDKVREELNDALERARERVDEYLTKVEAGQVLDISLYVGPRANLPMPKEHTEDYDRAIKMVEMSVDDTLELTEVEFAELVMDDWGWKSQFIQTSTSYTS